jgi:hypothetical protein
MLTAPASAAAAEIAVHVSGNYARAFTRQRNGRCPPNALPRCGYQRHFAV